MLEKIDEKCAYPRNPLGIIALFVFFIEAISTITIKFLIDANSPYVLHILGFIIGFPSIIVLFFFFTLWFRRESLYSPGDFREDASFVKLIAAKLERLEIRQEASQVDPRGHVGDVLEMINKLIEKGEVETAINLAKALLKVRRYQGSLEAFEVISKSPLSHDNLTRTLANTAYSLVGLGRHEEAIQYLNRLRALNQAKAESFWPTLAFAYSFLKVGNLDGHRSWLAKAINCRELDEFKDIAISLYPDMREKLMAEKVLNESA
jgi:tetratricopeptide (TPR) repeat protein